MEVGQGLNVGCSAKEKKIVNKLQCSEYIMGIYLQSYYYD
jgi:hypothetical protein